MRTFLAQALSHEAPVHLHLLQLMDKTMDLVLIPFSLRTTVFAAALALSSVAARAVDAPLAADTYVSSALPAVNFGTQQTLNVGGGALGLIGFDLSTMPAGLTPAMVSKATMVIFLSRVGVAGAIEVQTVNSGWAEGGVTAGNAPVLAGPGTGPTATVSAAGQYIAIDVTSQVKAWVNGAPNFGFAITPAFSAPGTTVYFDSKENSATGHPARLDVTLASHGPAGPSGPQGPTGATGPAGPQGIPGTAAAVGATGATGATGLTGPQGPKGDTGPMGSSGPIGLTGPAGVSGAPGPQGAAGASGVSFSANIQLPTSITNNASFTAPALGNWVVGGVSQIYNVRTTSLLANACRARGFNVRVLPVNLPPFPVPVPPTLSVDMYYGPAEQAVVSGFQGGPTGPLGCTVSVANSVINRVPSCTASGAAELEAGWLVGLDIQVGGSFQGWLQNAQVWVSFRCE